MPLVHGKQAPLRCPSLCVLHVFWLPHSAMTQCHSWWQGMKSWSIFGIWKQANFCVFFKAPRLISSICRSVAWSTFFHSRIKPIPREQTLHRVPWAVGVQAPQTCRAPACPCCPLTLGGACFPLSSWLLSSGRRGLGWRLHETSRESISKCFFSWWTNMSLVDNQTYFGP